MPLPPQASVLLESMRAIGYEPATAVADLVDNSITAGAKCVSIRFNPGRPLALAILDDGCGMNGGQLESAMRHGSRSPGEVRSPNDLGRFGLGLKTASMSQCRKLTVVTKQRSETVGMRWDLDDVADWKVQVLEKPDFQAVPFISELSKLVSGTLVVWENLDKIAAGDAGDGSVFGERMGQVSDHLGLVFHRFLRDRVSRLGLDINLQPVVPVDPFLEEDGSIVGQEERIRVESSEVLLKAFTLPHISRLTRAQIEKAGGEAGLRREQGFYVYRNRRLITWGTWFRMFRQEELTKLTRVRVDVPNALDHLWNLDIKKSVATPPAILRDRLSRLVPTMVQQSQRTNAYRGMVTATKGIRPIWRRVEDREGIRYEIDREHPIVAALRLNAEGGALSELDNALKAIAESIPIEALYNDRANDRIGHKKETEDEDSLAAHLEDLARQLLSPFQEQREQRERLLAGLGTIEPFAFHPTVTRKVQERLANT